jgi:hypothetical protein
VQWEICHQNNTWKTQKQPRISQLKIPNPKYKVENPKFIGAVAGGEDDGVLLGLSVSFLIFVCPLLSCQIG